MPQPIEKITDTRYHVDYDPHTAVIIGGTGSKFETSAELRKWGGESWLRIKPRGSFKHVPTEIEVAESAPVLRKIEVEEASRNGRVRFYPIDKADGMERGGFELETVWDNKPSKNTVVYDYEDSGDLDYPVQDYKNENIAVTSPEDVEAGVILQTDEGGFDKDGKQIVRQPDWCVRSIAIMKKGHNPLYRGSGEAEKWAGGKFGHIRRPKATDRDGKWVWCEINLDEITKTITVTVPQDFVDSAAYPVTVDPTFGQTSLGATDYSSSNVIIGRASVSPGEDGSCTSIHAGIGADWSSGTNWKCALYTDSAGVLQAPQTVELDTGHGTAQFVQFDVSGGTISISDQNYVIATWWDTATNIRRDSGGTSGVSKYQNTTYTSPWPSSITLSSSSNYYSTYATYTAGGNPSITGVGDNRFTESEANVVISGSNFGASETGSAKVELGNAAIYGSCTVKTTQSVDSWSDTSIQYDTSLGSLDPGRAWVYVTNSGGNTNASGHPILVGDFQTQVITTPGSTEHTVSSSLSGGVVHAKIWSPGSGGGGAAGSGQGPGGDGAAGSYVEVDIPCDPSDELNCVVHSGGLGGEGAGAVSAAGGGGAGHSVIYDDFSITTKAHLLADAGGPGGGGGGDNSATTPGGVGGVGGGDTGGTGGSSGTATGGTGGDDSSGGTGGSGEGAGENGEIDGEHYGGDGGFAGGTAGASGGEGGGFSAFHVGGDGGDEDESGFGGGGGGGAGYYGGGGGGSSVSGNAGGGGGGGGSSYVKSGVTSVYNLQSDDLNPLMTGDQDYNSSYGGGGAGGVTPNGNGGDGEGGMIVLLWLEGGAGNFRQHSFRGRDDDGSESGATWKAAANTNWDQLVDTNFRVRFLVQEEDDVAVDDVEFQLQYNLNSGGWNDVDGSSSVVRSFASGNFNEGDDTTQQIGSGTFISNNDCMDEVDGLAGGSNLDFTTTVDQEVEAEFCVQIRSADVSANDTIQLRLIMSDTTPFTTYSNTPTITAKHYAGSWKQAAFRARNDNGSESAATWKAALNANWNQVADTNFRIRFLVQEEDDVAVPDVSFQLQYNLNSGGWNDVNGSSSVVRSFASDNFTEGDDTTQQLGSGTYITNNDCMDESDGVAGGSGLDFTTTVNQEVEAEFCVQVRGADTSTNDTIQLRLILVSGDQILDIYSQTPTVTVQVFAWLMSLSSYFAEKDPTTAQLTAPGSGTFKAGQILESASEADGNDLSSDQYSEYEFCIKATSDAEDGEQYEFRVKDETQSGEQLENYIVLPKVTLSS